MKPILFSSDMVRAILDGRKTVTRRVVKSKHWPKPLSDGFEWVFHETKDGMLEVGAVNRGTGEGAFHSYIKPPYQPGDILYVRETWGICLNPAKHFVYKERDGWMESYEEQKWRPSIHMPREAARIFLRVTGVRVERLQEITVLGAQKEGIGKGISFYGHAVSPDNYPIVKFRELWNSVYASRGYGWEQNPYVWVIEFERVEKP